MASIPNSVAKEHPFQKAGLGLAPFRCIGVEHRVGPLRFVDPKSGTTMEVGGPGQPMGTCQFCGQGITDCYVILSSDKKRFIVGCDCVRRTYAECAETLPTDVERQIAMVAREKNRIRTDARRTMTVPAQSPRRRNRTAKPSRGPASGGMSWCIARPPIGAALNSETFNPSRIPRP